MPSINVYESLYFSPWALCDLLGVGWPFLQAFSFLGRHELWIYALKKAPKNSCVCASVWSGPGVGERRGGSTVRSYHLSSLKGNFWYGPGLAPTAPPPFLPGRWLGTFRIFRWFDFRLCPAAMPKASCIRRLAEMGGMKHLFFASELLFDMRLSLESVFRDFVKARGKTEEQRKKRKKKMPWKI